MYDPAYRLLLGQLGNQWSPHKILLNHLTNFAKTACEALQALKHIIEHKIEKSACMTSACGEIVLGRSKVLYYDSIIH